MSYPNNKPCKYSHIPCIFPLFVCLFVCLFCFAIQVLYDTLINQLRGQGFRYGITNDQFHFSSLMQKFANLLEMFLIAV